MMTEKKFKIKDGMYRLDVTIYNYDKLNCTTIRISVDAIYVNPLTGKKEKSWLGDVDSEVTNDSTTFRYNLLKARIARRLKDLASNRIMNRIFKEVSALMC